MFIDFFCDFGADEVSCKYDILDVIAKMLSIQPFNLPSMNDKLWELNLLNKSDEELDNVDFAKSSIENAINDEIW